MTLYSFDSFYHEDFYDEKRADKLVSKLENEIVYVPRDEITFSIYGRTIPLPRDKAFYGDVDNDKYPLYRYTGNGDYPAVKPWTKTTKKIRDYLYLKTGQYCNHLVVNRYKNGSDHIGLHQDKVKDFVEDSNVLTVSFKGTRKFRIKNMKSNEIEDFQITHGSLFILGSQTNSNCKHSIVKTSTNCDERISLTYRSIKTFFDIKTKVIIIQ